MAGRNASASLSIGGSDRPLLPDPMRPIDGLRLELLPIEDAPPGGPHWRMYVSPRIQGVGRDAARPTKTTPKGWQAVRQRQQCSKQVLAAIGMQAPFYQDELGIEEEE